MEREFTCEDWSHCLHRRSFKSVNWAIFVQSEDHKRIPPRMMNYAKIPVATVQFIFFLPWIGHEIMTLLQKLFSFSFFSGCAYTSYRRLRQTCHSSRMGRVQVVSTTMASEPQPVIPQIQRNPEREWIIKFIDDLSKMQSTEFTCPHRRNEFWQTKSKPYIAYQSLRWKNAL